MGREDLSPDDAPSVPAFQLYLMSCEDRSAFLTKFHTQKKETIRAEGTGNREVVADRELRLNALDKLVEAVATECDGLLEELLRMYPEQCQAVLVRHGYAKGA